MYIILLQRKRQIVEDKSSPVRRIVAYGGSSLSKFLFRRVIIPMRFKLERDHNSDWNDGSPSNHQSNKNSEEMLSSDRKRIGQVYL